MNINNNLDRFCKIIEYDFKNKALLTQALTHRSVGNQNNERLEFLGDSVLSTIISSILYSKFLKATEGELSRMRSHLVCEKTLATIAIKLQISDYINLGGGELKSGGYRRESILADALEALIGAIYLESGLLTCHELLQNWFKDLLENITPAYEKDPKTKLQEKLQALRLELPFYKVVNVYGEDHCLTFEVSCQIQNLEKIVHATGTTRRKAEQNAASKMLEELK